jgi:cell division protein FtsQ
MKTTPTPPLRKKLLHGAAAALVIALLAGVGWYGYDAVVSHPIRKVVFTGSTQRIPNLGLDALERDIRAGSPRPSLASIRESARKLPWVRDAGARRLSLDTVEVHFETHEPFARWNDDGLVSRRGEVFAVAYDAPLPHFRGVEGAAPEMVRQYSILASALKPLESPIAELRLTPRRAWQATLVSGLVIDLGRGDTEQRVARLVAAWPELMQRGVETKHADLRYANGFALRKKA